MVALISFLLLGSLLLSLLGGCAPSKQSVLPGSISKPAAVSPHSFSGQVAASSEDQDSRDLERLAVLWRERQQAGGPTDYPIGPGDVLEISVPDMKEIEEKQVRVSGTGTIILPLIGTIPASGLTEEELVTELRSRLRKYLLNPEINLFVKESHNRQVAVVGAVAQPGLYDLTSEAQSILDMVSLAGGMTEKAAPRLLFIPAEPGNTGRLQALSSSQPIQLASSDIARPLLKKTEPITIDIRSLTKGGNQW